MRRNATPMICKSAARIPFVRRRLARSKPEVEVRISLSPSLSPSMAISLSLYISIPLSIFLLLSIYHYITNTLLNLQKRRMPSQTTFSTGSLTATLTGSDLTASSIGGATCCRLHRDMASRRPRPQRLQNFEDDIEDMDFSGVYFLFFS